jgi:hypothetical protein
MEGPSEDVDSGMKEIDVEGRTGRQNAASGASRAALSTILTAAEALPPQFLLV